MSPEGAAAPDPAPGLPPRYEVRSFLGKGAMGRVFLCRDTELDVVVAVKVLAPHLAADPAAVESVRSEARAVAKFRGCPSILSLYGFEQHQGSWYLVMEYAAGGSLDEKLKREGRFPEAECRRLGAEVAEALDYAHRHRVLHRDIKPANILLDAGGRAKVADFGIAKVLRAEQESTSTLSISGTPVYIPPEAILRGPLDARSDIYSLGCMLYEMATGKRPFSGTPVEIFMLKMGDQARIPDVRALAPEISAEYAAIVHRAAAPSPGERFPDGASLAAALREGAPPEAAADTPTLTRAGQGGEDLPTIKNPPPMPAAKAPEPARPPSTGTIQVPPPAPSAAPAPRSRVPLVLAAAVLLLAAGGAWALFAPGAGKPVAPPTPPVEDRPARPEPPTSEPPKQGPPSPEPSNPDPQEPEQAKPEPSGPEPVKPAPPPPFEFAVKTLPAPKSPLPPGRALPAGFEVKDGRIACLKDRSEMVLVPEGTFPMGSETGDPDEKPVRQVTLSAYLIDRHEVTVAQYRAFCDAEKRTMPAQPGPELGPVIGVTWEEAAAYAAWAGKRLPTEAEWERAARGTDGRTFPWGNETTDYECNRKDRGDGFDDLAPVGSFKDDRSPADCFDMGGNAQEWCADWYAADAYAAMAPAVDPTGPLQGTKRVVRGGGANLRIAAARCSLRSYAPDFLDPRLRIGFRCAASLPK